MILYADKMAIPASKIEAILIDNAYGTDRLNVHLSGGFALTVYNLAPPMEDELEGKKLLKSMMVNIANWLNDPITDITMEEVYADAVQN